MPPGMLQQMRNQMRSGGGIGEMMKSFMQSQGADAGDMEEIQRMMAQMGGAGGMPGMPGMPGLGRGGGGMPSMADMVSVNVVSEYNLPMTDSLLQMKMFGGGMGGMGGA